MARGAPERARERLLVAELRNSGSRFEIASCRVLSAKRGAGAESGRRRRASGARLGLRIIFLRGRATRRLAHL
jgi:hypothetical protein